MKDFRNIESTIIERDVEDELIWLTMSKYTLFMSYGKIGIDAKALYEHYQFTSILQRTNSVRATDKYCRQGLDWGRDRFDKAKQLLIDLGLISHTQRRDSSGKFEKSYIKVHTKRVELEPSDISRVPVFPQSGIPACGESATNAYTNNINAFTKNENACALEPDEPSPCQQSFKDIRALFESKNSTYYHDGKQAKCIKGIMLRCEKTGQAPVEVIERYHSLTTGTDKWWAQQPFTPCGLLGLWDRVMVTEKKKEKYEYFD